jgi:signal transduction histidine kinase
VLKKKEMLLIILFIFANTLLFLLIEKSHKNWSLKGALFNIEPIYPYPIHRMLKTDINGDLVDDIIAQCPETISSTGFNEILLFSPFRRTNVHLSFFLHLNIPTKFNVYAPVDFNNDGKLEIPLIGIENRQIFLHMLNLKGKLIKKIKLEDLSLPLPPKIAINIVEIADLDGDNRYEAISYVDAQFHGIPRGFVAHDPISGKKKWEFLFGAMPSRCKVMDLDHDGKKEFIFSAWASHNGTDYNGMNDDTCYLGVLDCNGNLLWKKECGGFFSEIYFDVGDLNSDGQYEIVTSRSCHREVNPDPGEIRVYSALRGKLLYSKLITYSSLSEIHIINLIHTPEPEIVVGGTDGIIRILSNRLKTLRKLNGRSVIHVKNVEKISDSTKFMVISLVPPDQILFYDQNLKLISTFQVGEKNIGIKSILPISNGKEKFILVNADKLYLISKNRWGTAKYKKLILSNFSIFVVLLIFFNFLFFLFFRESRKARKMISMQAGRMNNNEWAGLAQELVHRMKTPLTSMLWETEKMKSLVEDLQKNPEMPSEIVRIPDTILGDIKELKRMNRDLMKFLQMQAPRMAKIDLNALLKEISHRYAKFLEGKISFKLNLTSEEILMPMDEEQIIEALSNIIENAIDALPDGGEITISTSIPNPHFFKKRSKEVGIIIEDNGKGIPKDKLYEIFRPYYTTKKEGFGIGLAITQKIIETHNGTVKVESQPGVGTRFALYFPWKSGRKK